MASLGASLERTVAHHGQRTAVIDGDGRTWDWSSWRSLVARSASWLAAQGLQRGQRFAIVGLNSSRYAALLQAGFRAGCIPVPINHRLAPREVAAIMQQAQCRRWLVEPEFAARSLGVFSVLQEIEWTLTQGIAHYYLGYWIEGAPTMHYKASYRPHELLHDGVWVTAEPGTMP